jgi:putative ABC transport system substrate-binding protein
VNRRELLKFTGALGLALCPNRLIAADLPRIGILDPGLPHLFDAFFDGMKDHGYIEGETVAYIRRATVAEREPLRQAAAELAGAKVDLIVTAGPLGVRAAMIAASNIPIVFAALGDAIANGVVTNLAHPSENATGFSFLNTEISTKRVELLNAMVPDAHWIAVLWDSTGTGADLKESLDTAAAMGLETKLFQVARPDEYEGAFKAAIAARTGAIDILASPAFNANRELLISLAGRYRLPAMYETSEYVYSGGLMSYGPSLFDLFRRAAGYVDQILKGAKPVDLPVQQPTKFELLINLKTAKVLGLTVPQSLLARADEVIE